MYLLQEIYHSSLVALKMKKFITKYLTTYKPTQGHCSTMCAIFKEEHITFFFLCKYYILVEIFLKIELKQFYDFSWCHISISSLMSKVSFGVLPGFSVFFPLLFPNFVGTTFWSNIKFESFAVRLIDFVLFI